MKEKLKIKLNGKNPNLWFKLMFIFTGIASTIWFLIRVIPKPSRATYPCMKVAAPFMSSLVIYLLSLGTTTFALKRFRQNIRSSKYLTAGVFLFISIISFSVYIIQDNKEAIARSFKSTDETFPIASNDPIGEAKGLFPGRVVWVHYPQAVDQSYNVGNPGSDWWWSDTRVDEESVKLMLNSAIRQYAGENNIGAAWDAIFKSFNKNAGRGEVGYQSGEKIAIKINLTNQCCSDETRMDATPQLINALLNELIANAGVNAADITIGDPYRDFRSEYVNLVKNANPSVNFVDGNGGSGVTKTVASANEVLVFSDGVNKSTLPQHYLDATYFINMPCLKTHNEGGITLIAKNHQGSYLPKGDDPAGQSAMAMHYCLPANSQGTNKYRHTVDYMGHEETGGKGLIYIIDGIWAGESWEGYIKKYKSAPFNNSYPSSIFIGQDPVALESVCYDILFEESVQDPSKGSYPIDYKDEISDYLLQCASSAYWPSGITYDPEGDGSPIGSLGVFEHWNNAGSRQYTRNLGTGDGIELLYISDPSLPVSDITVTKNKNLNVNLYPNPAVENLSIAYESEFIGESTIALYSIDGKLILNESISKTSNRFEHQINVSQIAAGSYILKVSENSVSISQSKLQITH